MFVAATALERLLAELTLGVIEPSSAGALDDEPFVADMNAVDKGEIGQD
jgi:hypothetical protein